MPPRPYNSATRLAQQSALKERIAQAAAELHKGQGVLGTSHAQVAQEAGVSVPTVYKHFPTLEALVKACSAHVASQAPGFPAEQILQAPNLTDAARALVRAMDAQHAYFAPWAIWHEERHVATLGAMAARQRGELMLLCEAVLSRHRGPGDHRSMAAWWQALLSFNLRESLVVGHGLSRTSYRRSLVSLLLAACGPQPANVCASGPLRKS